MPEVTSVPVLAVVLSLVVSANFGLECGLVDFELIQSMSKKASVTVAAEPTF